MILPRQARDKHRENSQKARFLEASELIKAVSAAVAQQESNMSMWTDIEVFSHPNYTVAPTARFLSQLELEWPYVSGATIWEFTAYMDPHGCSERNRVDCKRLYDDYRHYYLSRSEAEIRG